MAIPPYARGEEIRAGTLYRRIPNFRNYYDHDSGLPTFHAFTPRPQDNGAFSAHLKDYVSEDDAATDPKRPDDRSYGLCELDIADMRTLTQGAVTAWYAPSQGALGHAHVRVLGCADEMMAQAVARMARVIRVPGTHPPTTRGGAAPDIRQC
jgi:hypothetical protein